MTDKRSAGHTARNRGARIAEEDDDYTYSYMTTVQNAENLPASIPGLRIETVFGQESILAPYRNVLSRSPKKVRMAWYEYALRFCEKKEYLTHTEHLMIVSEKIRD